ncbi:hypothetical protein FD755_009981 [Muntiacus reevesi]|uniref:Liprin-alpha-2 n=1 Tax=Muntiacus reevesi TaxID=9886 RepID=A0A5N3XXC2_MUNRE|nr:hypothetical protein FD755_009981 [Muntiacus reevesi]
MMCEVMPTINEDTPMSQRGSQSSGSDSDSHFEQLMVNMLDERDRLLDTLRETQESLSLAQQRLQDVIYDRDSLQRQLNSALPQETPVRFLGWEDPRRRDRISTPVFLGFPGGCDRGRPGLDPSLGRFPWSVLLFKNSIF